MFDWIQEHDDLLLGLGLFSMVCFAASVVVIPILIARIPRDYFAHGRREAGGTDRHPLLQLAGTCVKNLIGVVLVLAGVMMLILPGQGILTILIGLLLMNFPGKYALEKWLVRKPAVLKSMNWIRSKASQPPLLVD